jgi:hypothetical protein
MERTESTQTRKNDFQMPPFRPLKVYAFDPTRGRTLGNHMTINTQFESLEQGPVGRYLEVIDYDASNRCYYQAVNLDDPRVLLRNGLDPDESDPQFHQQMVYAVASETIRRFEYALGRNIRWRFSRPGSNRSGGIGKNKWIRLRIFPHAMQEANAFYNRDLGALLFGYFASDPESTLNFPGQTVFTCLSHDIIVHETTHALVDSQRDYFTEPTSPDAIAFHEAFADIVALFQHFTFKEPLLEMIRATGGKIFQAVVAPESEPTENGPAIHAELRRDNPLVGLALQFGEAMGMRKALRSAIGSRPNSKDIERLYEPHSRGSILVAAVFDAFFSVYVRRTKDLMRIARASGAQISPDNMHPDLVNRLADTASKTADNFLNICVRALDYCPPVDILFGDFLRAMITADHHLFPDDKYGYRAALIDAFRSRGIFPESVTSLSEESLLWEHPEYTGNEDDDIPNCTGLSYDVFLTENEAEKRKQQMVNNAKALYAFARNNAKKLGLSTDPKLKIEVRRFNAMYHVSDNGRLAAELVVQITQSIDVPFDKDHRDSPSFKFRGGITLILDKTGQVLYIIHKSIDDKNDGSENNRLIRQRDYLLMRESDLAMASYVDTKAIYDRVTREADFSIVHRGY